MINRLVSNIDSSVNMVEDALTGFIESRYVRKTNDYIIGYLSSQTGCNRGCRFCHLTATKQTKVQNVNYTGFMDQAHNIFQEYYDSFRTNPAKYIHWNFMARGEPLNNPYLTKYPDRILYHLGSKAAMYNLQSKFNISTIMPRDMPHLNDIFKIIHPTIYYSIYSNSYTFREKWMPNAMDVDDALRMLKEYQDRTKKIIKFHSSFIKNENDSMEDIDTMMQIITEEYKIAGEFNIVRYNPYSLEQGEETPDIERVALWIKDWMPVKIIPRVGYDVKASCGMFVQ